MRLLTAETSSPKLKKSEDGQYLTAILYLAGAADPRLCPCSTPGCRSACLVTNSGRGIMSPIKTARQRKTDFLFNNRPGFIYCLKKDIDSLIKKAKKQNKNAAVRLNGGSDLDWSDVYSSYPDVQFWEYTKRPDLAVQLSKTKNVHVTYSHNENTTNRTLGTLLANGINIAAVFNIWSKDKNAALPKTMGNMPVIDGDQSDLRFLDPPGVVVGLKLKSARKPTGNQSNIFLQRVGG